jgi:hypothetical protein
MSTPFTDIKITDLETVTQESATAPGLRQIYFSLSTTPPEMWCRFFQSERQFARRSMWRKAWIEHGSIVVDCTPEEIERQLEDLKTDVAKSNTKYREYLAQMAQGIQAAKQAAQQEQERMEGIRKRLNFD